MNRRIWIAAIIIGSMGCATQKPEEFRQTVNTDERVVSSAPAEAGEQIEVADIPRVAVSPGVSHSVATNCRRESELGSRRMKRRCRTRAEVEQSQSEAEDILGELQRMGDLNKTGIEY